MINQNWEVLGMSQLATSIPYDTVCFPEGFCGVRDEEGLYATEDGLYRELLEYFKEEVERGKYSLCLQVRDGDKVVFEFSDVSCPGLFWEQLKIRKS